MPAALATTIDSNENAGVAATTGWQCRLDLCGANQRLREADEARQRGELGAARVALVEALRLHPAIRRSYDAVGSLLVKMGLPDAAEQCFRGVLPDCLVAEWFDEACKTRPPDRIVERFEPFDQDKVVRGVERLVCHTPRTRDIAAPGGIAAPIDRMFNMRQMTSTLAFVDRVENGCLWFDNFNRAVLDAEGQLVDHHTRGNPALILDRTRGATPTRVSGRAFFVGNRGSGNYYHWMLDILPSFQLFWQAGYTFREDDRVVVFNGSSSFQRATLERLGFGPERVIELERGSPWLQADELVVPFYMNAMAKTMGDWVPAFLQKHFLDVESSPTESSLHDVKVNTVLHPDENSVTAHLANLNKLYLARSSKARNGRSIANEAAMKPHLEARGFVIVNPEDFDVNEQARLFSRADIVLASHGAALTNIVFCKPGARVVELYGEYMETCYWALSEVCGLIYYNHRCEAAVNDTSFHQRSHREHHDLRRQGFSVDLDDLDALLDLVLDEASSADQTVAS